MARKRRNSGFWECMTITKNNCWEWQGTRLGGYGQVRVNGKLYRAHRYAYELTYGPIPGGLLVRHKCDNPPCCNPGHLELGTHTDNVRDAIERGRFRTCPPSGENASNVKLTAAKVQAIRQRYAAGESQSALAREHGVTQGAIWHIVNGKRWRNGN